VSPVDHNLDVTVKLVFPDDRRMELPWQTTVSEQFIEVSHELLKLNWALYKSFISLHVRTLSQIPMSSIFPFHRSDPVEDAFAPIQKGLQYPISSVLVLYSYDFRMPFK
jgi:hypothetical protein